MAHVALIIAPAKFRDEELFDTQRALEQAGHSTTIASRQRGSCTGMLGGTAHAVRELAGLPASDFDAVAFVGGGGAAEYFDDPEALRLARETAAQGKPLGAICIAPTILANAGLLAGRRVTAYPSEHDTLTRAGAQVLPDAVVVDGNIVTANGPRAAQAFGEALAAQCTPAAHA